MIYFLMEEFILGVVNDEKKGRYNNNVMCGKRQFPLNAEAGGVKDGLKVRLGE